MLLWPLLFVFSEECLEDPVILPEIYCLVNGCIWLDGRWRGTAFLKNQIGIPKGSNLIFYKQPIISPFAHYIKIGIKWFILANALFFPIFFQNHDVVHADTSRQPLPHRPGVQITRHDIHQSVELLHEGLFQIKSDP